MEEEDRKNLKVKKRPLVVVSRGIRMQSFCMKSLLEDLPGLVCFMRRANSDSEMLFW
jgi:hypothetical protein